MENTLRELKEVHSSSLIIILFNDNLRIYDEDCNIVEFISNFVGENGVLVFKFKYINKITKILKKKKINYIILDKEYDYKVYDYYYCDHNTYNRYLKLSKKFNFIRRYLVHFYNFIFGLPSNMYK